MNIIILAAGKGSRMRSSIPKVLHQIGGESMISRIVGLASRLRPKKIFIVVGQHRKEIEDEILLNYNKLPIVFVHQKSQLGTANAVKATTRFLTASSETLILFGDVPLLSISTLRKLCKKDKNESFKLLTAYVNDPKGYGRILRGPNNQIQKCIEEKDANKKERFIKEINSGIMILSTRLLKKWIKKITNTNSQQEYYLLDMIPLAYQENIPVKSILASSENEILGVNTLHQKAMVERIYQSKLARKYAEDGLEIADMNRFDVRGKLIFGCDVKVDINCVFIGKVTLADGVVIGPNCVIQNSFIGKNTVIKAHSSIENSSIGNESEIGPYSRIRSNCVIGDNCKIGNFVETKNIKFKQNSKASHLAYLGDTEIGERVNIGAGTITCNYDGINKHTTIVEDDVFIGSNSEIVAPVTIKKGAKIGAGTTLTKDVPENSLATSRNKQNMIKNWKKKK